MQNLRSNLSSLGSPGFGKIQGIKRVWSTRATTGCGYHGRGWNWASRKWSWEYRTEAKMAFRSSLFPNRRPKVRVCSPTCILICKLYRIYRFLRFPTLCKVNYCYPFKVCPGFPHHLLYSEPEVSSCAHPWMGLHTSSELHGNDEPVAQRNYETC